MNQTKIKSALMDLYNDCAAQSDALNARNDVRWDCYDKSNWDNMIDCIIEIANELNINLDIEECDE